MRNRSYSRTHASHRVLTIAAAAAIFALTLFNSASAYTLKTLHSFCTENNCGDGLQPWAGLLMDQAGNLYGTTAIGGKYYEGVVFKLIPNAKKTKYAEHILKNFCAKPSCPGGKDPLAGLIMDVDGNLYGTTGSGGKFGGGVVFKMAHRDNGWSFSVIHSFCGANDCAGGTGPTTRLSYVGQASGAPWDEFSPLFGTTYYGGANGKGVAYQLTEDGSLWNYEVLHSFNASNGSDSADPGPVLVDSSLNLYGVTASGGRYGFGVLYRLAGGTWKETTLHNFCAEPNCADSGLGLGQLAMDAAGDLFGATLRGGAHGSGGIFERTAGGAYSVIYNFCSQQGCTDGFYPAGGLTMDAGGELFGATVDGGTGDNGTIFKLSYDSGTQQWTENILYNFCGHDRDCKKGKEPHASLIVDASGNLYGTTFDGGANGDGGTVFELTP